ncbi:methyl-accepting chemotaxis protein [Sphingomonas sp. MMS24-J45]|uniref:methyl-accepting chemotaxis protein n=1 Tax=Sphingomonas sp. MMS24-J45 TaxID=3238806 RepID=UPI00384B46B3
MIDWFIKNAPIRIKLLIAFGLSTTLTAIATLAPVIWPSAGFAIGAVATGAAVAAGLSFRRMIATPYVSTVVRMEALAAGDLHAPIAYTDYTDCVGRLTKAMFTFRDAAVEQIEINRQAEINADVVRTMVANIKQVEIGNLSADITVDFPESYAELKHAFNAALANLRELIGCVACSAEGIRTGSDEIAHASEDLARRTELTATSLQETLTALGSIDARVQVTTQATDATVQRADQAIDTVGGGRSTADEAVQAMTRVSESAKGIDSVIEGLDKIAFQTRVLAMNAAVEAGRAGDAGRGFAVVADLVSALAMRAEEEAKRARDQLTVTQDEIGSAVEAVRRVDGALLAISSDVAGVHSLLCGISTDNAAQTAAIADIRSAVSVMDQTRQQNAAMVEGTSAAAQTLADEVAVLSDQTARFTIDARPQGGPVHFRPSAETLAARALKVRGRG